MTGPFEKIEELPTQATSGLKGLVRQVTWTMFIKATGYMPENDDLERCNCEKAGEMGHQSCGWCETHNLPRFHCGCA
jgi:hypothetical protein